MKIQKMTAILLAGALLALTAAGCGKGAEGAAAPESAAVSAAESTAADAAESTADTQGENAESASVPEAEKEESMAGTVDQELMEKNAKALEEAAEFTSKYAVRGAAQHLIEAGCGEIGSVEITEKGKNTYTLKITDKEGKVFVTVMDKEGYIGPIQDGDGNYLYAPVE